MIYATVLINWYIFCVFASQNKFRIMESVSFMCLSALNRACKQTIIDNSKQLGLLTYCKYSIEKINVF